MKTIKLDTATIERLNEIVLDLNQLIHGAATVTKKSLIEIAMRIEWEANKEHVDGSGNVTRHESVIVSDRKNKA